MRDSAWSDVVGTVADETRAGTRKVRMSNTFAPKSFSVKMRFSTAEYYIFRDWFDVTIRKGAIAFLFPDLETSHPTYRFSQADNNRLYRFKPSSTVRYSNTAGDIIDVDMEWEEV